ncbi:DUF1403 family protein [Aminobacter sp. MSH1]|uniref:DUF1403 family protein n=1 Tax=Aminobacter sp. MSH1 TaxID=374606 RepID=UPI000D37F496|nr:DUF1403 family protein [Aminobacter sp. MSH1]
MILRPKPHRGLPPPPTEVELTRSTMAPVPAWLRITARAESFDDAGFAAGAAVSLLDLVVRRQDRWAGVWRQRLALSAAVTAARRAGRAEDEAALRDASCLTRPGDDVGPAGRLFLAWRRLATRPVGSLLSDAVVFATADCFGFASDEALREIAATARDLSSGEGVAVTAAAKILDTVARLLPEAERGLGPWLADAVLAQKLNWPVAVPLLGVHLFAAPSAPGKESRRRLSGTAADGRQRCLAAAARAAIEAVDLSAELARRAERLVAVAPKLRAKGSNAVVEKLLGEDAVVASQDIRGISDRGLRRLFDRLVDLGVVRELSGRSSFRVYGL